jgi:polyisoprenyl-phosphate glycosyltransferase
MKFKLRLAIPGPPLHLKIHCLAPCARPTLETRMNESQSHSAAPPSNSGTNLPLVSLVIPMLNERDGLDALFAAIQKGIEGVGAGFELVVVDDGSTDGTRDVIEQKLSAFDRWQLLVLSRNFGQQAAYRAGLGEASGDAVIFLEADLQDPPHLIGELIAKWRAGFRVVTAVRTSRAERGPRRWAFDLYHVIFHQLTDRLMPANSGMYALIDRTVVNHLLAAPEVNLFLPALKNWFGYSQTTVPYARLDRASGKPKQSFRKLLNYGLNGLLSFSDLPLQWIGAAGVVISLVSFGYAAFLAAVKIAQLFGLFASLEVKGFTTLAVAVFCLGGVQLLCLGIVGQYLARIYREIKGRPLFIIEKKLQSHERR